MKKLIIYLTNLTHVSDKGIAATESIPLNIGYLAAYAKKIFKGAIEIELFNSHTELIKAFRCKRPHILGASNYAWNSNLSYFYLLFFKKRNPNLVTIMGGPTFSNLSKERELFLRKRSALDFYISQEGEVAFAGLVGKLMDRGINISKVKFDVLPGCHYLTADGLISGPVPERLHDLDLIPSPYLEGILDKFLERGFTAILQSNRGCPFSCAYCCSGIGYYNKVNFFSVARVKQEIEYVAKRAKSHSVQIHDDNFGMFDRDYEITKSIKEAQKKHGWPVFVSAATGKNKKDKILKCVNLLGASIPFSMSVQSTDKGVLKNIRRTDINNESFLEIQQNLKGAGTYTNCELIVPLPGETRISHLEGIKSLMSAGVDSIVPYTTMLLPASSLGEDKEFDKFKMRVKFRVLPRDFGKHFGNNIVETEKVCVGTKDFSLKDYLLLREFHLVIYCYYDRETFKELFQYLESIGLGAYDFCYSLLLGKGIAPKIVKNIFKQFLSDAESELWDSAEEIYARYSDERFFNRLVEQKEGCNLLQKYNGIFFSNFKVFLDYAFTIAKRELKNEKKKYNADELGSIYLHILKSRANIFDLTDNRAAVKLPYDILSWKSDNYHRPLAEYNKSIMINYLQSKEQKRMLENYIKTYGKTPDSRGKILTRINPALLFRKAVIV